MGQRVVECYWWTGGSAYVTKVPQSWKNIGLMCSDGLTRHVSDERIREVLLKMTSAKEVCETLLQDALDAGGEDNITIACGRSIPRGPTSSESAHDR
jgi:Serine/threonine protein phosphatase